MVNEPVKKILLIEDSLVQHDLIGQMVGTFSGGPWELECASTYSAGLKKIL